MLGELQGMMGELHAALIAAAPYLLPVLIAALVVRFWWDSRHGDHSR